MTGLQEAFYIIAIVFMAVMFILALALVTSVLVIRKKINHIHDNIESKINTVASIAGKSGALTAAVATGRAVRKVKKTLSKK